MSDLLLAAARLPPGSLQLRPPADAWGLAAVLCLASMCPACLWHPGQHRLAAATWGHLARTRACGWVAQTGAHWVCTDAHCAAVHHAAAAPVAAGSLRAGCPWRGLVLVVWVLMLVLLLVRKLAGAAGVAAAVLFEAARCCCSSGNLGTLHRDLGVMVI
eukprot:scaffold66040_cov17-Tisochrysis_lutea.AAC.1